MLTQSPFVVGAAMSAGTIYGIIGVGWAVSAGLVAWKRHAGALAAAVFGLAVSLYLGLQHHSSAGQSACSVSEYFDCDAVNSSVYAELGGIPIAFLGAAFYGAVAAAGALALARPASYRLAGHVVTVGALLSVVYSAFLAYVSLSVIGKACLFCISLYGVNAILLAAGLLTVRDSGTSLGDGLLPGMLGKDDKSLGAMVTAGLVVFIGSMAWYNSLGPSSESAAAAEVAAQNPTDPAALRKLYSRPAGSLEVDGTEPILGSPSAPYTLVEFADFECPYCGLVFPQLHDLVDANSDLQLQFKHYPLSPICNESMGRDMHPLACGAAASAECARQQGKFWELSDLMFKNQQFLKPDEVSFMAKQAGLDLSAFSACVADSRAMDAVKADIAHAEAVGITGTPSLFLKGVVGDGWVKVEGGPEEVALLLEAARKGVELAAP